MVVGTWEVLPEESTALCAHVVRYEGKKCFLRIDEAHPEQLQTCSFRWRRCFCLFSFTRDDNTALGVSRSVA